MSVQISGEMLMLMVLGAGVLMLLQSRTLSGPAAARAGRTAGPAKGQRTMPRYGTPGTITKAQIDALAGENFLVQKFWSREEADLLLDAVAYQRAVCRTIDPDRPPLELQNELLGFILEDDERRETVMAWGRARREGGGPEAPDPSTPTFQAVLDRARRARKDG